MTKIELALALSKMTKFSEEFLLSMSIDELQKVYDDFVKWGVIKEDTYIALDNLNILLKDITPRYKVITIDNNGDYFFYDVIMDDVVYKAKSLDDLTIFVIGFRLGRLTQNDQIKN